MRPVLKILALAAAVVAAHPAGAQADSSRALTRPLSAENNSTVAYSYTRESHLVERDLASVALARRIEQDLVALRVAQDIYFANHLTYAITTAQLEKFQPQSGAVFALRDVSDRGWTAEATHASLPKSTFVGTVRRAPTEQ